jgi:hypothetical protein
MSDVRGKGAGKTKERRDKTMYCTECITPLRLKGAILLRFRGTVKRKTHAVCPACNANYIVMRERPVRVWPKRVVGVPGILQHDNNGIFTRP